MHARVQERGFRQCDAFRRDCRLHADAAHYAGPGIRRRAHTEQFGHAVAQVAIEGTGLLWRVARIQGIEGERDHVIAVKARIQML